MILNPLSLSLGLRDEKKHSRFEQYNVTTLQGASMSMRVVFVVPSTD